MSQSPEIEQLVSENKVYESTGATNPTTTPELVRLDPDDVRKLCHRFTREAHPYFPAENVLELPFREFLPIPDPTVGLFRWSYPAFCFEKTVLERCGFASGRPLLEAGSGNNDISRFEASAPSFPDAAKDRYYISNYSGGRGDYFALQMLSRIFNNRASRLSLTRHLDIENICMTLGGQGALHAIARFFSRVFPGRKLALVDSSYVGTFAPFVSEGVPISTIPAGENCDLPSVESVLEAIRQPDVLGFMYVPYHNPTGQVWSKEQLIQICAELVRSDKYFICSEVFDGLDWSGDSSQSELIDLVCHTTGLQKYARIFSVSKSRGLAGFRAGFMIGSEEITWHASQVNALSAFNTPVTNSRLLVMHEYLTELLRGGSPDDDIDTFLRISPSDREYLLEMLKVERAQTRSTIKENFNQLLSYFNVSSTDARASDLLVGENASFIVPTGGINCLVRLHCLEGVDEIDLFRKIFLWSGLILHTSRYLHKTPGRWLRVTLSHEPDRLQKICRVISAIPTVLSDLGVQSRDTELRLV